jgi:hypothetical protein
MEVIKMATPKKKPAPRLTEQLNCKITVQAMEALRYKQFKTRQNYGSIVTNALLKMPKS